MKGKSRMDRLLKHIATQCGERMQTCVVQGFY